MEDELVDVFSFSLIDKDIVAHAVGVPLALVTSVLACHSPAARSCISLLITGKATLLHSLEAQLPRVSAIPALTGSVTLHCSWWINTPASPTFSGVTPLYCYTLQWVLYHFPQFLHKIKLQLNSRNSRLNKVSLTGCHVFPVLLQYSLLSLSCTSGVLVNQYSKHKETNKNNKTSPDV